MSRPVRSIPRPAKKSSICSSTCIDRLGITVVLVTHDPRVAQRAERLIHIRDGRIESDDPTLMKTVPRVLFRPRADSASRRAHSIY